MEFEPPWNVTRVAGDMYEAMKWACLKILPKTSPGLTVAEIQERVIAHLSEELPPTSGSGSAASVLHPG